MTITKEQLEAWRKIEAEATPGPWTSETALPAGTAYSLIDGITPVKSWSESPWRIINGPPQVIEDYMLSKRAFTRPEDGAFIAAAREIVPALIAEVERLTPLLRLAAQYAEELVVERSRVARLLEHSLGVPEAVSNASCDKCGGHGGQGFRPDLPCPGCGQKRKKG